MRPLRHFRHAELGRLFVVAVASGECAAIARAPQQSFRLGAVRCCRACWFARWQCVALLAWGSGRLLLAAPLFGWPLLI